MPTYRIWNRRYTPRDFNGNDRGHALDLAVEAGHIKRKGFWRKVAEIEDTNA